MPEICEVVLTAQALKDKFLNKVLTEIKIIDGRYAKKPFDGYNNLVNNLSSKLTVIDINTKGKFLWFKLQNKDNKVTYLLNTFGLAGRWAFEKVANSNIKFTFDNTEHAYYVDSRNFGTFEYDETETSLNSKLDKLAPDLLKTNFTKEEFKTWVKNFLKKSSKRKDMLIVKVLMSQNKNAGIGAGLGNYLVPEILYRAKISPHKKMGNLTDTDIFVLAETIKSVLKQCYVYNVTGYMADMTEFVKEHYQGILDGKYPNYHPEVIVPKGSQFLFSVYRQEVDPSGNKVVGEKIINNRTTYWVPTIQF